LTWINVARLFRPLTTPVFGCMAIVKQDFVSGIMRRD
jgi:hypothetical protein